MIKSQSLIHVYKKKNLLKKTNSLNKSQYLKKLVISSRFRILVQKETYVWFNFEKEKSNINWIC